MYLLQDKHYYILNGFKPRSLIKENIVDGVR